MADTLRELAAKWREEGRLIRLHMQDPALSGRSLALMEVEAELRGRFADELEAALAAPAGDQRQGILVDRDADLRIEMRRYLDGFVITSDNIGDVRRSLFVPWDSAWNGWVRDETAARENKSASAPAGAVGDVIERAAKLHEDIESMAPALKGQNTLSVRDAIERHLRDAMRASAPAGEATPQWQPIETAPKDGTRIVAIGRVRHDGWWRPRACVTRWHKIEESPAYAVGWEFVSPGYADVFDPTHWMPLPDPLTGVSAPPPSEDGE